MKIDDLIKQGWKGYINKVANGLVQPENEKMMQLQLAQIFQNLAPIYEYSKKESIKILLEVPVVIRNDINRIVDIVISHQDNLTTSFYCIELKCFRLYSRNSSTKKRGAQNLGMYDYWEDIENIEGYSYLKDFEQGYQLTLTDDPYYVKTEHKGDQVSVYSTNINRPSLTGCMECHVANRRGKIELEGIYDMKLWMSIGDFYFISQQTSSIRNINHSRSSCII